MLEDVRDPGIVRRQRPECDGEGFVLIAIGERQHLRLGSTVPEKSCRGIQLGDGLLAHHFKVWMST
jgi:hypothetical protein